ncbi:MAG: hypothetical protein ACOC7O_01880 [Thermoplasmatota archaeon]
MIGSWTEILLLLYAIFLSTFHILCKKISVCIKGSHIKLLSFGGGSLLALIFLVLLPDVVHFTPAIYVYPLMLLGFVMFFLTEKYMYQHVKDPDHLEEELYHLHALGFFLDHFAKGFILVTIVDLDPILGFLTAIPFFIHTLSSTITLDQIHTTSGKKVDKFLLSSSFIFGTLAAIMIDVSHHVERGVLAFIVGMLFFIVSRDVLPKKKEGKPFYFLIGTSLVFFIWLLLEYVVI